jgi:hypothetical protein
MRPKGKLLALIVMFAAVGLLTATGAFTTVEADRTADVQTAGDASALLGLNASDNSNLIEQSGDEVTITLASTSSASGVNVNATTTVNGTDFLNVTNNGQEPINLNISTSGANGNNVYLVVDDSERDGTNVEFANGNTMSNEFSNNLSTDAPQLISAGDKYAVGGNADHTNIDIGQGETVNIGMIIVTDGGSSENVFQNQEVTITAESIDSVGNGDNT